MSQQHQCDEYISMVNLAQRYEEISPTAEPLILDTLRSGHYIGGPLILEAEATAAKWFNRQGAVGVNSGTDALILSLQALGIGPDDEVILPAITFFATAGAVCAVGATPVIVDTLENGCMDPNAVDNAATSNTKAIIPVHLFGNPAKLNPTEMWIIDDAAQAIGASPPPKQGILTALSTYPTKTWGGVGDGGFVIADDLELLQRVRTLGNHGLTDRPHVHHSVMGHIGRNSRLDSIQAAALIAMETTLLERVEKRREIATQYNAELHPDLRPLPHDPSSPVHQYLIRHSSRDQIQRGLNDENIQSTIYYPLPLNQQPALQKVLTRMPPTPTANRLCDELLAIPVHAGLNQTQTHRIIHTLNTAVSTL
jgi:dTDP-4-amino-4,6-dideoxygalactose transaminase